MSVVEADDDDSVHLERECREERLCGLVVVVVDVSSACRNGRVDKVRDCGFRRLSSLSKTYVALAGGRQRHRR